MLADRYEIGTGSEVLATAGSFERALINARHYARRDYAIYIYDRMAHFGRPRLWALTAAGEAVVLNRRSRDE